MPLFHITRTVRTYETLLGGERTGAFSDYECEGNFRGKNAAEAEAKARAEGGNFRIDEVLSVTVEPHEEWRRRADRARWAREDAQRQMSS